MFDQYQCDGLFDEMFELSGKPRPHYGAVASRLNRSAPPHDNKRVRMADLTFRNQGITFTVYNDQRGVEKIFPFDLMPRIIPANEWDVIERGLVQRITALNLFCQDIYRDQRILKERIIPAELIYGAKMFRREMFHVSVPRNIYIHICGTDLIRDKAGNLFRSGRQWPHAQRRELRPGKPLGHEARISRRSLAPIRCGRSRIIPTTFCSFSAIWRRIAPKTRR